MAEIITPSGIKVLDENSLKDFTLTIYNQLKSLNSRKRKSVIEYLSELNGNSVIPDPDEEYGSWRTDLKSSIFFQKTIFAYLYLRSLMTKSTENLITFNSSTDTFKYLPSAYKKIFNYAVSKSNYFEALDKSLYYAILSSIYAIKIEGEYFVDEFDDVEFLIKCEAIHPLNFNYSADGFAYSIDRYIPIDRVYKLKQFWKNSNVEIKRYNASSDEDITYFKVQSLTQKPVAKLTTVYTRYIDNDDVSIPYKFTILNDTELVDYEPISDADRRFPVISVQFYSDDMQISYADLIWDYYKEDSRFLRAIIDRALLSTAMGFEVNTLALDNQMKELTIKPFTVVYTQSEVPAIRPFTLASFDPNVLPVRQLILQEAQNVSALTEFLMGLPTSKGRPTAKEVAIKTQMNQQIISTIIYRLENSFIKQSALKLISLYLQYKFNDVLLLLNDNERQEFEALVKQSVMEGREPYYHLIKTLYKGIDVRVEGLSGVLQNSEELDKIMSFIELVAQYGLTPYIDFVKVFELIFKKMGIPSDIVRIPTQELQAMAQQQAQQSQLTAIQMAKVYDEIINNKELLSKVVDDPQALMSYINSLSQLQQTQYQGGSNE